MTSAPYESDLLNEREQTHGDYEKNARVAQSLKAILRAELGEGMPYGMYESIDLICTKFGRIAAGDPYCIEHWEDIAGYANLVSERLKMGAVSTTQQE